MGDVVKDNGRIYTPANIVKMMLDYAGYIPCPKIWKKHVIDNSCGDGRILCEVVSRYIESYPNVYDWDVREQLKEYIHGIELDEIECEKCKENLNRILDGYHIERIDWDIKCGNALNYLDDFRGTMDYVFGNPPYVRMKNIKKADGTNDLYKQLKWYGFASKGMSDLYLAFYQLGLEMRNSGGILCYIAPSSWTNSASGEVMRNYIWETRELEAVIDFQHHQVFDNATTYVMITLFTSHPHNFIRYDNCFGDEIEIGDLLSYEDVFIDRKMYFSNRIDLENLQKVIGCKKNKIEVKNGYATLADDIFIDKLPKFKKYTIDVVKASTGKWKKCLFPYDKDLNLIPLDVIEKTSPEVYDYLSWNFPTLDARTYDSKGIPGTWHSLGRSQGLKDTFVRKIAVNNLVKVPQDMKLVEVPAGCGVYGGLYIKTTEDVEHIKNVLVTWDFIIYVRNLRKYKSGGYYTFSSKDLEKYLNYKMN